MYMGQRGGRVIVSAFHTFSRTLPPRCSMLAITIIVAVVVTTIAAVVYQWPGIGALLGLCIGVGSGIFFTDVFIL